MSVQFIEGTWRMVDGVGIVLTAGNDERVEAWELIAAHPYFATCYGAGDRLLDEMLAKLDRLLEREQKITAPLGSPVDIAIGDDAEALEDSLKPEPPRCAICGDEIEYRARLRNPSWAHVGSHRIHRAEPATPYVVRSCAACGHAPHGIGIVCGDSKRCGCRG